MLLYGSEHRPEILQRPVADGFPLTNGEFTAVTDANGLTKLEASLASHHGY